MIRTPYIAVKRAQKRIPCSKIVLSEQHPPCLKLASGEVLTVEQAAEKAGINYVPYVWHETRPGGAIYHE